MIENFLLEPSYGDTEEELPTSLGGVLVSEYYRYFTQDLFGFAPTMLHDVQLGRPFFIRGTHAYIFAGDEPTSIIQPNLMESLATPDVLETLKNNFLHIPRQVLRKWLIDNIYPNVPKIRYFNSAETSAIYEDKSLWNSLIQHGDLFTDPATHQLAYDVWPTYFLALWAYYGKVNLEHITENKLNVWAWEYAKYIAWQQTFPDQIIEPVYGLNIDFIKFKLGIHVKWKYRQLEPIADFGLEYTRELSIKKLIEQGEYIAALGAIESFMNVDPEYAAVLTKELDPANNVLTLPGMSPMLMANNPLLTMLPETQTATVEV